MFQKSKIDFEVLLSSEYHIHGLISSGAQDKKGWFLIGLYGHLDVARRSETWGLLNLVRPWDDKPWLGLVDFNEVLHLYEKWGGKDRLEKQMEVFRSVLVELRDLGFSGTPFTWFNNRDGDNQIMKGLIDLLLPLSGLVYVQMAVLLVYVQHILIIIQFC